MTRRILVLGPRGSGKSTLVNTWQSIHSSISHQDREIQKSVILENIFESTQIIVDRISKEDEFLDDEHLHQQVEYVLMNHIEHGGKTLSAETLQSLRDIWGNSIFQAGLAKWLEEKPVIGSPSSLLHRPEAAMFFST
ncbi:Guanine nucleotide-binding protein subunit alpha [Penicillium angulare]|uniref:Guanine nucleotide-binding protein subunit alpha n=1 Tax=Penicillium angulare TaxID=116970 RepID=A0A9W9EVK5_9EURO|nr:Guanine nucleotide-binding protein subunit alpha [Penicillium angulare]